MTLTSEWEAAGPDFRRLGSGLEQNMLGRFIIGIVYAYRGTLGLFMGGHCRFHPTCSQYMIDAIRKYGATHGAWRGVRRICRCHPFSRRGGYDPA